MARFYSNENLPMTMVEALRKFNHDVLTSYEAGQANKSIPDNEVLAYATFDNRSVITLNRDDFIALHRSGINHSGIVICKDDRDYLGQAQFLHSYLDTQLKCLQNRLIRVQKQNKPKLNQQIFIIREYTR
jgi:predicted nuclease of predicted toxin-antitoxin system